MEEGDYHDRPQSPMHRLENLSSGAGNVPSNTVPEYDESKQEAALPPGTRQFPMIPTSPSYSVGFMPQIVGGPLAPLESTESQARDVPRFPSFVVSLSFSCSFCCFLSNTRYIPCSYLLFIVYSLYICNCPWLFIKRLVVSGQRFI